MHDAETQLAWLHQQVSEAAGELEGLANDKALSSELRAGKLEMITGRVLDEVVRTLAAHLQSHIDEEK